MRGFLRLLEEEKVNFAVGKVEVDTLQHNNRKKILY